MIHLRDSNRKVVGSRPDELIFMNLPVLSDRTGPCSLLRISRKSVPETKINMFLRSRAQPILETDNLTAIREPTLHRPPRPVTGTALTLILLIITVNCLVSLTEINDRRGSAALTKRHPSIRKSWH
jgi:hypothetical protein